MLPCSNNGFTKKSIYTKRVFLEVLVIYAYWELKRGKYKNLF